MNSHDEHSSISGTDKKTILPISTAKEFLEASRNAPTNPYVARACSEKVIEFEAVEIGGEDLVRVTFGGDDFYWTIEEANTALCDLQAAYDEAEAADNEKTEAEEADEYAWASRAWYE